jgi:opacity protein-like surface antigen
MKKFLVLLLTILGLSTNAFAITEGDYFGVDLVYSVGRFREEYTDINNPQTIIDPAKFNGSHAGFGINYRHAFNYGGLYIAPGAFLENNNLLIDEPTSQRDLFIKNRFGGKIDLGYDLTDKFSLYLTTGYAMINYNATNIYFDNNGDLFTSGKTSTRGNFLFGFGGKIDISKNLSLVSEYSTQEFDVKTRTNTPRDVERHVGIFRTRIHVTKIGLAYKF